jgi:hypothetical protein
MSGVARATIAASSTSSVDLPAAAAALAPAHPDSRDSIARETCCKLVSEGFAAGQYVRVIGVLRRELPGNLQSRLAATHNDSLTARPGKLTLIGHA